MAQHPAQAMTKIGATLAWSDVRGVPHPGRARRAALWVDPRAHAIGVPRNIEEAVRLDSDVIGEEPVTTEPPWTQGSVDVDDSYGLALGVAAVVLIGALLVSFTLFI